MEDIIIEDLSYGYMTSSGFVLRDINLRVEKGEFLGITGPTGAGKTTLCRCLNGLVPHVFQGIMKGSVVVAGMNTKEHKVHELSQKAGMAFQDPESQFLTMTVEDEIIFGLENLGFPWNDIHERLEWALKVTRMEGHSEKSPYELSVGQKQRVAIAAALAMRPEILVLDEPMSQLDPIGKAEVFLVVGELAKKYNITVVMVEHHVEELVKYADKMILLYDGMIELEGHPAEFFGDVGFLKTKGVPIRR